MRPKRSSSVERDEEQSLLAQRDGPDGADPVRYETIKDADQLSEPQQVDDKQPTARATAKEPERLSAAPRDRSAL